MADDEYPTTDSLHLELGDEYADLFFCGLVVDGEVQCLTTISTPADVIVQHRDT